MLHGPHGDDETVVRVGELIEFEREFVIVVKVSGEDGGRSYKLCNIC